MGYDDRGDWVGIGKGDAHSSMKDYDPDARNSSSGNGSSGGGCMIALLALAGSSFYGIYQLVC